MRAKPKFFYIVWLVLLCLHGKTPSFAGTPLWLFSSPNPNLAWIAPGQTETLSYNIINQSSQAKNLTLKPIAGVGAYPCYLPFKGSSCNVTLTINGSAVSEQGVHGGPMFCEQGNINQCYQPEPQNQLNISLTATTAGHLVLTQAGGPVRTLSFQPGDSGTLVLQNTGSASVSALNTTLPLGWQSYFNNNCSSTLAPQQSCTITYAIPSISATGILNPMTIQASNSDNSLNISVNIEVIGGLRCWGLNLYGQLGVATNNGNSNPNNSPISMPALTAGVKSISSGKAHRCALLDTGGVKCWGRNYYGQLGSKTNSGSSLANVTPMSVLTLSTGVDTLSAHNLSYISCAIIS